MMKSIDNCTTTTPFPVPGKLNLCSELTAFLNDKRIKLLDAIQKHGSLIAAARALPIPYKIAWAYLDSINNLADEPLLIRSEESPDACYRQLTPYAQRLVSMYQTLSAEYQASNVSLASSMANKTKFISTHEIAHFQKLMRRMSFRSSERNQLIGVVTAITPGKVNSLVYVNISAQLSITAMISCESVCELNLTVGSEVAVLIKASQITVCQQPLPASDLTNQFTGKLTQVHNGEIYSELCIELDDQKRVSTIVANETLSSLNIRDNMALNISFFASSVILCCYN